MDFDFTKILLILVLVTGVLWTLDFFLWRKKRDADDPPPAHVEWGASFFPILLIVFFLRSFVFEPFQIPSSSMVPTLEIGDFLVVSKFSYGVRMPMTGATIIPVGEPQRGDVAVFIPPHDERYFIKRVIGLPGDLISIVNNQVSVNGVLFEQEFLSKLELDPTGYPAFLREEKTGEIVHQIRTLELPNRSNKDLMYRVPEGHYFMMGDNRDNSSDSRVWGPVPESNLVGRAKYVWMHWRDWGVPSFSRAGPIQ